MARPKKEKELRRTHPVMLRFTDTECERLLVYRSIINWTFWSAMYQQ